MRPAAGRRGVSETKASPTPRVSDLACADIDDHTGAVAAAEVGNEWGQLRDLVALLGRNFAAQLRRQLALGRPRGGVRPAGHGVPRPAVQGRRSRTGPLHCGPAATHEAGGPNAAAMGLEVAAGSALVDVVVQVRANQRLRHRVLQQRGHGPAGAVWSALGTRPRFHFSPSATAARAHSRGRGWMGGLGSGSGRETSASPRLSPSPELLTARSEGALRRRLRQAACLVHGVSQCDEDVLDRVLILPVLQNGEAGRDDLCHGARSDGVRGWGAGARLPWATRGARVWRVAGASRRPHLARGLVHALHVDAGDKFDLGGRVRVAGPRVDVEGVDAVTQCRLRQAWPRGAGDANQRTPRFGRGRSGLAASQAGRARSGGR